MPLHSVVAQLLAKNPRRQARFPDVPLDQALREFESLQTKIAAPEPAAQPAAAPTAVIDAASPLSGPIASIVTNLWRAKLKLVDAATGEPKEETRRLFRHIEGALETFQQLGVTITELMNQPYDAGLPVKVLTFQPMPGLERDTIVEVVRPTIISQDTLLQMGEIIVGIRPELPSKPL
jgi:hypothetical protein